MRKKIRERRSTWKRAIIVQLFFSMTAAIYGCGDEKLSSDKQQNMKNESIEMQQELEGEKMKMTTAEMEKVFENVVPEKANKGIGNHNPVMTQRFGADPYALVYDGRVYLYMTCDEFMRDEKGEILENNYSEIYKINVISSADLVNWTDHGSVYAASDKGVSTWGNNSWAPAAAYKEIDGKMKFFLYFLH